MKLGDEVLPKPQAADNTGRRTAESFGLRQFLPSVPKKRYNRHAQAALMFRAAHQACFPAGGLYDMNSPARVDGRIAAALRAESTLKEHKSKPRREFARRIEICERAQITKMKEIVEEHECEIEARRSKQLRETYRCSPRRAHELTFAEDANKPAPKMTALNHPVHGKVNNGPCILESLEHHHRALMSPKVPENLATQLPMEDTAMPHPFLLQSRGSEHQLADRLTWTLTMQCIRSLKNNKSTGPDGMPNELLKHLPPEVLMMLHEYFKMCWASGRVPEQWHNSYTLMIPKKLPATDPANYRPIGLHCCMYKLYSTIVARVLQQYSKKFRRCQHPRKVSARTAIAEGSSGS